MDNSTKSFCFDKKFKLIQYSTIKSLNEYSSSNDCFLVLRYDENSDYDLFLIINNKSFPDFLKDDNEYKLQINYHLLCEIKNIVLTNDENSDLIISEEDISNLDELIIFIIKVLSD